METTPVWIKAGLTYEQFSALPPGTRLALSRTHDPQPVIPRRPNPNWRPTPEQQAELAAITNPHARVAAYREMEAAARTQAARQRQG
jgi:hypothetical protein